VRTFRRCVSNKIIKASSCYCHTSNVLRPNVSIQFGKQQVFPSVNRSFHSSSVLNGDVVQFKLADIGEGIAEVQVTEWYVEVGDKVDQFDQICEVKSDKASVTITSRFTGTVTKLHYDVDDEAKVGTPLVDIEVDGSADTEPQAEEQISQDTSAAETLPPPPPPSQTAQASAPAPTTPASTSSSTLATPAVRKIAKENNINLAVVPATGKDGRVLKEDILKFLQNKDSHSATTAAPTIPTPTPTRPAPIPVVTSQEDEVVPIKGMKKAMVKSMEQSLRIPHFGYCDEIDVTELIQIQRSLRPLCMERGVKLSFMPFFLKAASIALTEYPMLNGSFDEENMSMVYKKSHNIGIAMDTKDGLLVPNIKNIQLKSVFQVAQDLNHLHELGKQGKLGLDDLTGGTFTLSNIGSIGGTYAKPVIAPPEVAIGALGKIQHLPRFDADGELVKASIFNVSWSADHRVIDGATMARYSNLWKSYLETPSSMILDMK